MATEFDAWREAYEHFRTAEDALGPDDLAHRWILEAGLGLCALNVGRLAEAERRRERLPTLPSNWSRDPTIVGMFLAALKRIRGQPEEAADLLAGLAAAVIDRFPVHSLRLKAEEIRYRRRFDPLRAQQIADECIQVCEGLQLNYLQRLIESRV